MTIRLNRSERPVRCSFIASLVLSLVACSGGGGDAGPSSPPPPTVVAYNVTLDAENVAAGSTESGTATALVKHNTTDALLEVSVDLANVTAEAVSLRRGYAGDRGTEIFALQQGSSANEWSLGAVTIGASDVADLQNGALHLVVTSAAFPDGALRGQILPQGIDVFRVELDAGDVAYGSTSTGAGAAWLTLDGNASMFTIHVQTIGLDDADGAALYDALAGAEGPSLGSLVMDSGDAGHWQLGPGAASTEVLDAMASGRLYLQMTTPAEPAGAVRGQFITDGMELVRTELSSDNVVMTRLNAKPNGNAGRLMTTIDGASLSAHLNLFDLAGSTAVELRQAPSGQNGPPVASFEQDINDPNHWALIDFAIAPVIQASLDRRTLYVSVVTDAAPNGAARGQIETASSTLPPDDSAFLVTMSDPANATMLDRLPPTVFFTLNREPLPASVTPQAVTVEASGQDGSFGDGNETVLTPASVIANGNTIEVNLAGVQAGDDTFRVSVQGGGADGVVDTSGIALDGDGDGEPGGSYESAFDVQAPPVTVKFSDIRNQIFTPTCAGSGCHSGNNPPDGLRLTAGDAYSNIVNVPAVQNSQLMRIEPGNPDDSYLVRKIQGSGIVANRMPLGGPPLSQEEIQMIRQWVIEGAPNN